MANYKVGDLDVTISGVSQDAVDSLGEVIMQLDALQGKLGVVGGDFTQAFKSASGAATRAVVGDLGEIVKNVSESQEKLTGAVVRGNEAETEHSNTLKKVNSGLDTELKLLYALRQLYSTISNEEILSGQGQAIAELTDSINNASKYLNRYRNDWISAFSNKDVDGMNAAIEAMQREQSVLDKANKALAQRREELRLLKMSEEELLLEEQRKALADFQQENATRKQRIAYLNLMLATGQAGEKTREYKQELKQLVKQQQIADKAAGKIAKGGLSKLIKQIGRIALYRTIRRGLQLITQAFTQTIQDFAKVDDSINDMISRITSSGKVIQLSFGTIMLPLLKAIEPIVYQISVGFSNMANTINQAMAKMQGLSEYTYINADAMQDYRKQLEKTSGALFDFDKFRALSSKQDASSVFLSKKEIGEETEAVSQMQLTIKSITNLIQGLWNVIQSGWNAVKPVVMVALGIINNTIIPALSKIFDWVGKVFKKLDELNLIQPLLIGIGTALGFIYAKKVISGIASLVKNFNAWHLAIGAVAAAIGILSKWDDFNRGTKIAITVVSGLATALLAAATAAIALRGTLSLGTAIPLITAAVASGVVFVKGLVDIPNYATGASDIDSGTIFRAGEAGKTEAVFTGSNGKTNVANVQQMAQADYQGTIAALNEWWKTARNDIPQLQPASDTGIYQAASRGAGKAGKRFTNY